MMGKKRIHKRHSLKMSYLFWVYIILMPIADAINGILLIKYNIGGFGTAYHMALVFFCIIVLLRRGIKKTVYFYCFVVCVCSIAIAVFLNVILGESISSIGKERVLKILITIFLIFFWDNTLKCGFIRTNQMIKLVYYQCASVFLITFISDITGVANMNYGTSGARGLYAGSNEPTIIFIILLAFLAWFLLNRQRTIDIIFYLLGLVCLIFTESKSGIAIAIVYAGILFAILWKKWAGIGKIKNNLMILIALVGGVWGGLKAYNKIKEAFLARQYYLMKNLGQAGALSYISSGRTIRIRNFLFERIDQYFTDGVWGPLVAFLKALFGNGIIGDMDTTLEMDYLDLFLYGGIIWGICGIVITYFIMKRISQYQKSKILLLCTWIIIAASFFVGHALTGGSAGFYLALAFVFYSSVAVNKRGSIH